PGFTQYQQLVQFWLSMYGQAQLFAFDCPWDDSRANQQIGVGDGSTFIFTIYRTWGLGATATLQPIGLINTVFSVEVNGTPISTSQYQLNRNKIEFIGPTGQALPPGDGVVITMTFSFYYLCQFVEDEQDFEEFARNRWRVPSLKFQAVDWP